MLLSIDPYQEQAFGCPVTELDGKVTWFGTLKSRISEVRFHLSFIQQSRVIERRPSCHPIEKDFCAMSHSLTNLPCFFFSLKLSPGSSLCHHCSLVFLYTGQYAVSISCSDVSAEQVPCTDTSSAIAEKTRSSETLKRNSIDRLTNAIRKSWTFSPPIKINVVE